VIYAERGGGIQAFKTRWCCFSSDGEVKRDGWFGFRGGR